MTMIAKFFIFNLVSCSGFILNPPTGWKICLTTQQEGPVSSLWAKATKKKKKGKKPAVVASRGGFGKVSEKAAPTSQDGDYSVFPALESQVSDTLIRSPPELQQAGELPIEVYDRLDQIYGFQNFNIERADENNGLEAVSFDELISSPVSGQQNSSIDAKSTMSDNDFADLLAAATGGSTASPPAPSVATSKEDSRIDSISSLPPFTKFRVLHVDPLVLAVDDFFTEEECDRYVAMSTSPNKKGNDAPFQTRSMTVGKDALAKSQRTSTTWFHNYKNVPELIAKASRLLGLDEIDRWEEPQTVRYRRDEKFTWHLDALSPAESSPKLGGQRTATLLVYLTDLSLEEGGATIFRDLAASDDGPLKVQPRKGSALLFFPAAGGIPNTPFDIRTLHCGEAVDSESSQDKWISQLWLRESSYSPSAPPGNNHAAAKDAVTDYCMRQR